MPLIKVLLLYVVDVIYNHGELCLVNHFAYLGIVHSDILKRCEEQFQSTLSLLFYHLCIPPMNNHAI